MTTVTRLKPLASIPNDDVINELEALLVMAKKGEIQVFTGCYITDDLTMSSFIAGEYENHCINMVGIIEDLKYDLLKMYNGDR